MSAMRIVIIGGVAGGASAAARARRLSETAEIVLIERGPHVSFANCGLPYHLGGEIAERDQLFLQTPESMARRARIDVRVLTEATEVDPLARTVTLRSLGNGRSSRERYDKLILAPGAAPIRPPLAGIDDPRIHTLRSVEDVDRLKELVDGGARSALVVGAGFIGIEVAENLVRRGLRTTLVEMQDQVLPPLDAEMAAPLHEALRRGGVDLRLSRRVAAFEPREGGLTARLEDGSVVAADLALLAIGVRPETALALSAGLRLGEEGGIAVNAHQQTSDPDIYACGDAVEVRDLVLDRPALIPLAGPANRQGRIAADHIFGRDSRFRGTQGTCIVRAFDRVAGMTGASEKALLRAGRRDFDKIYIHPNQHAGYFPGAAPLALKLIFSWPEGRVLGAQITGGEGVDKRIDVLAMAIQAGMTVFDLEEAELAYAPQFGSAKDPINFAGFTAANVLRGDHRQVHAAEIGPASTGNGSPFLLDVRDPDETAAGTLPGAAVIPLCELRDRLDELPRDRAIAVYCKVGLRGYLAQRILSQNGFEAANLSGGTVTWRAHHGLPEPAPVPAVGVTS